MGGMARKSFVSTLAMSTRISIELGGEVLEILPMTSGMRRPSILVI